MNYRITCLTPTLVGDGQRLSPVDYMVWKDQVNVLDQRKIFRLLAKGPRLDGYLAQLKRSEKLDFASWGGFAQNFAGRRIPFEHASMTQIWEKERAENLFIPTFAANAQGAYLPASALKGALRTGSIFVRWNQGTLEDAARRLETERSLRRVSSAEEGAAVGSSGGDRLRFLMAADSAAVAYSAMKVYLLRASTLNVRPGNKLELGWKPVPLFAEMAGPGTTFEGRWSERAFFRQPEIAQALHWRKPERSDFLKNASEYAGAQLAAHRKYAEVAGLSPITAEIDRLEALRQSGACLLCIGWAGGFLSKSAYPDTTDDAYRGILRGLPFYARAIQSGLPFPKTRKIVFRENKPATLPGWVRLEVE